MAIVNDLKPLTFSYDNTNEVFQITWNDNSRKMNEEEYKETARAFTKNYSNYAGKPILHDMRDFMFTITPVMQDWIAKVIMADLVENYDLKKMAFIMPEDIFANISTEQVSEEIDDATNGTFHSKYFDNPAQGLDWLLS